jgi:hypothetical protein
MILTKKKLIEASGLTKNEIDRLIFIGVFVENLHFKKVSERKILFDENALFISKIKGINDGEDLREGRQALCGLINKWKQGEKINRLKGHKREQEAS